VARASLRRPVGRCHRSQRPLQLWPKVLRWLPGGIASVLYQRLFPSILRLGAIIHAAGSYRRERCADVCSAVQRPNARAKTEAGSVLSPKKKTDPDGWPLGLSVCRIASCAVMRCAVRAVALRLRGLLCGRRPEVYFPIDQQGFFARFWK